MTAATSSEESLISMRNGSRRESSPDLVRLDAEHLSDIVVSDFVQSHILILNRFKLVCPFL